MKSNVLREALDEQSLIEIKVKIIANRRQKSHMGDRLSEEEWSFCPAQSQSPARLIVVGGCPLRSNSCPISKVIIRVMFLSGGGNLPQILTVYEIALDLIFAEIHF